MCIRDRALSDAQVKPSDIGYINAHATATPIGDLSEIKAIKRIFGNDGGGIPVSSTKGLTGHGLSLSSAMEAGFCCLALHYGILPGSANIDELDPDAEGLNIITESVESKPDYVLTNSSGFGGANVSVVLKRT